MLVKSVLGGLGFGLLLVWPAAWAQTPDLPPLPPSATPTPAVPSRSPQLPVSAGPDNHTVASLDLGRAVGAPGAAAGCRTFGLNVFLPRLLRQRPPCRQRPCLSLTPPESCFHPRWRAVPP